MEQTLIEGNPAWMDGDSADGDLILAEFEHGGSIASITLDIYAHDGSPKVEVGVELTPDDCRRLAEQLTAIVARHQ